MALTRKQQKFIDVYLANGFNATRAARLAGYSERSATVTASRLLTKPGVKDEIDRRFEYQRSSVKAYEHRVFVQGDKCDESLKIEFNDFSNRRAPRREYGQSYHVYLIRAENGFVKIGRAANVQRRFNAINTASPLHLELIASVGDLFTNHLEAHLHEKYAAKRVKGEWFNLSGQDVEDIIRLYGFNRH